MLKRLFVDKSKMPKKTDLDNHFIGVINGKISILKWVLEEK